MNKTTFNLTQAGRIVGKSRATIQRAIAKGKLSCERDENQNRVVRADELIRVYGDQAKFERAEPSPAASSRGEPAATTTELSPSLQKMQDQLIAQYRGEIERLESALKRAQEGQNLITGLIEDQRSSTDRWREVFDVQVEKIANRIASQNDDRLKQIEARHERDFGQLKRTLQAKRPKTLWQKLFG